jgi:hypothetical protein
MRLSRLRRRLTDESGVSMLAVMLVMIATSGFIVAGFAAANGDLPMSRDSQDRKNAYAAAESGLHFYQFKLNRDNDYWTKCTNVPAPSVTEKSPVNQKWSGSGEDKRVWRNVPGGTAQYTIELLPAAGFTQCEEGKQESMLDTSTGTFKIRVTGRPSEKSKVYRTIIATFRRNGFLDFLYFTDFETTDPLNYGSSPSQTYIKNNCADRYRSARGDDCLEIQFADNDAIKGPLHSNDDILTCDSPEFGRLDDNDRLSVSGPSPGYTRVCSGSKNPVFNGSFKTGVPRLPMPATNSAIKDVAAAAYLFTGKTTIRFNSATANMTVTNPYVNGGAAKNMALPPNGVIYVKQGTCGTQIPPQRADYSEPNGCAQLYVSGSYTASLTLASEGDIIIRPPAGSNNGNLEKSGDHVLGLIANGFVRVYHPVDRSNGCKNVALQNGEPMNNVTIEAAIMALQHSFTVDNYSCGAKLEDLTVKGGIAQKYRGAVGTSGGTGYIKDYNYDNRLRYRSPPYFLTPVAAAWGVIRQNEQVPPVRPTS